MLISILQLSDEQKSIIEKLAGEVPAVFHCPDERWGNAVNHATDQHPDEPDAIIEARAIGRILDERRKQAKREAESKPVSYRRELWAIIFLLALIALLSGRARAQLDGLEVKAAGVQQKQWAGGFARVDFGSGLLVSCSGTPTVCVVTATGVAPGSGITTLNGLTTDPQTFAKVNDTNVTLTIGSVTSTHTFTLGWAGSLSAARGGTGSAANTGAAGKVLIGNGSGAFIEGDPLVQGVVAAGASLAAIAPVYVGGVDGSGNSKGLVLDASGRPTVNVNGTLQVQSNSANIATETTVAGIKTGTDKIPAQGQALAAASLPVVLTALQVTALTPPAAITNFANETGGNLAAIKADVDKIPAQGQALAAGSTPVVLPVAQITTLTPPAAITNFANETGGNLATVKTNTDALGANADASSATGSISAKLRFLAAGIAGATSLPAGSNIIGNFRIDQTTPGTTNGVRTDSSGATGSAPPSRAELNGYIGSGATGGFMAGAAVGDTYKNINIASATTTLLITGVSGRQVRISALHMIAAAANNIALIEGTGATCGTGTAGMAGGTTAASGYNLAANGGIAFGSGLGTVIQTATAGDSVCAVTSGAGQISGGAQYAIY